MAVREKSRAPKSVSEPPKATARDEFSAHAGNPDFMLSLARGLRVIESFENHPDGRSIVEIGHSTGLSPVAVITSATFWTWLWGPIGLVLATPLTMSLVVLGRHVDRLKFLDVMFGDEPALKPEELIYQRRLAGDPVEAAEQAQEFLKEQPLLSYYQDVVIEGLKLAQADADCVRSSVRGRPHPTFALEHLYDGGRIQAPDLAQEAGPLEQLYVFRRVEAVLAGSAMRTGKAQALPGAND